MSPELDVAPRLEVPVQLDADDVDRQPLGRALGRLATPARAREHDDESDQGDRSCSEYPVGPRNSHSTPISFRATHACPPPFASDRKSRRRLLGEATLPKVYLSRQPATRGVMNASAVYWTQRTKTVQGPVWEPW